MEAVKFYPDHATKNGEIAIYVYVSMGGRRLKFNTDIKVNTENWDNKKCEVKRKDSNSNSKNRRLFEIKKIALEYYSKCFSNELNFNLKEYKRYLLTGLGLEKKITCFIDIVDLFLKYEENKITDSGKKVDKKTVRKYELLLEKLKEYEKKNNILYLKDVDKNFLLSFQKFLTFDKNFSVNQIHKDITLLKTILNYASENGYNIKNDFRKFKVPREQAEHIYLYHDEIMKIYNTKMPTKTLEDYKFAFLVGCFTGARPSDYIKFNEKDNITVLKDGTKAIIYHAQKTGKQATIPFNPLLEKMISERCYIFPKINPNTMNRNIKTICQISGIERTVQTRITKGGKTILKTGKAYNFVVGKTPKRSFVTIAHTDGGLDLRDITDYTGNCLGTIDRYYIRTKDKNDEIIKNIFTDESK